MYGEWQVHIGSVCLSFFVDLYGLCVIMGYMTERKSLDLLICLWREQEYLHFVKIVCMEEIFRMIPKDIESISNAVEKGVNHTGSILNWFNAPHEDARNYLQKMIMEDEKLSEEGKIALIYNSRKLIREFGNQKTIYEEAKKQFFGENEMDEDWLAYFFEYAKNVSDKSIQSIWSKILADEYNTPGTISRKLIHTLSLLDKMTAEKLNALFNCTLTVVRMDDDWFCDDSREHLNLKFIAVIQHVDDEFMESIDLSTGWLMELENQGFIAFQGDSHFGLDVAEIEFVYHDVKIEVKNTEECGITIGHVLLKPLGAELFRCLQHKKIEKLPEICKSRWEEKGYSVKISKHDYDLERVNNIRAYLSKYEN